jgi:hypothetical protein
MRSFRHADNFLLTMSSSMLLNNRILLQITILTMVHIFGVGMIAQHMLTDYRKNLEMP